VRWDPRRRAPPGGPWKNARAGRRAARARSRTAWRAQGGGEPGASRPERAAGKHRPGEPRRPQSRSGAGCGRDNPGLRLRRPRRLGARSPGRDKPPAGARDHEAEHRRRVRARRMGAAAIRGGRQPPARRPRTLSWHGGRDPRDGDPGARPSGPQFRRRPAPVPRSHGRRPDASSGADVAGDGASLHPPGRGVVAPAAGRARGDPDTAPGSRLPSPRLRGPARVPLRRERPLSSGPLFVHRGPYRDPVHDSQPCGSRRAAARRGGEKAHRRESGRPGLAAGPAVCRGGAGDRGLAEALGPAARLQCTRRKRAAAGAS
jgi:hypothetical protein